MDVKKGTYCFIDDANNEPTNQSVSMDKDRFLQVGDILIWCEDLKPQYHNKFKVTGFADFMPVLVEVE